eukprot:392312_1
MEAWLIIVSIATIPINITTKLLYTASARSPSPISPIQNKQFTNFADSPSFGFLHEKENGETIPLIFENLSSLKFIKSQSLSIKLSPDERFITIGYILRPLDAHEFNIKKNRGMNVKMTSEIMSINYWTYLI